MVKHENGRRDNRYSVAVEHTGRARPQHVARFCGEWVGSAALQRDAWQIARDHAAERLRPPALLGPLPATVRQLTAARPFHF